VILQTTNNSFVQPNLQHNNNNNKNKIENEENNKAQKSFSFVKSNEKKNLFY
jgi:hypothetical protein